jgi:tRNA(Phe) wybutosine-synthesizing methylase Tyw3
VGTGNALHSIVARKVAEFLDKAATNQRLVRMQQRLRQLCNRLEEALETATDNRKRAERVLVRCRQT